MSQNAQNEMENKSLAALPANWFWPMDPENPVELPPEQMQLHGQMNNINQPIGTIGCQPSQEAYVLEERDQAVTRNTWQSSVMNRVSFPAC